MMYGGGGGGGGGVAWGMLPQEKWISSGAF